MQYTEMTPLYRLGPDHSPEKAGSRAIENALRISTDDMKGAHDSQFVFAGGRAYVVYEANAEGPGDRATSPREYSALSVVDPATLTVESSGMLAHGGQKFSNVTLGRGNAFVPRVIKKDEDTLRFFFSNVIKDESAYIYYTDYDLRTGRPGDTARILEIMTPRGPEKLDARVYAEMFRADGHECLDTYYGFYLFDIFDIGDVKYIALNNFVGGLNSLARFRDGYGCVEIVGNIGGLYPGIKTTESGIAQLWDGSWMAILRNETGDRNCLFSYSSDGRKWTDPSPEPFVVRGASSKPVLRRFGDWLFMGWNEGDRSTFHLACSRDAKNWRKLFTFRSDTTFQYPFFGIYGGRMYFSATSGIKERILFGRLPVCLKDGELFFVRDD